MTDWFPMYPMQQKMLDTIVANDSENIPTCIVAGIASGKTHMISQLGRHLSKAICVPMIGGLFVEAYRGMSDVYLVRPEDDLRRNAFYVVDEAFWLNGSAAFVEKMDRLEFGRYLVMGSDGPNLAAILDPQYQVPFKRAEPLDVHRASTLDWNPHWKDTWQSTLLREFNKAGFPKIQVTHNEKGEVEIAFSGNHPTVREYGLADIQDPIIRAELAALLTAMDVVMAI